MKKLMLTAAFAALAVFAEAKTKLPTYAQVAGVSGQVTRVQADVDVIKNLMAGGELASPFMAGIEVTYNMGEFAHVPEGVEYFRALSGAVLMVQAKNHLYRFPVDDLKAGAVQRVYVPCDTMEDVTVHLQIGQANHVYSTAFKIVHLHSGAMAQVGIDTLAPLDPQKGTEEEYRMMGRAQFYDPANEHGKRTSGESFPIQRIYDADAQAWVTQFGCYSNSVWVSECDIYNQIPQLDETGAVANEAEVGQLEHAYETKAFPWCECEPVIIKIDDSFLNDNGQATPATNLFYFSRVPIYVYKETIETLAITNFAANGTVASVTECPLQIHWVARPSITNGIDTAFQIPPWEKVYKRVRDEETLEWSTEVVGVKEANYYACYKTSPTAEKNGNWRMAGSNIYTLQSYPWPYRDGSNYGVWGGSRGDMHTRAQRLNPFAVTMHRVKNGTELGEEIAYFPAPTGDMATRRWAGNNWHDYRAFQELAYIQFGADVQNTRDGIKGNNTTGILESRMDDLESYYAEQTNLVTFVIGPRAAANLAAHAWLRINNFWGSEGDQMADVTGVAESDADGTKSFWWLACLDRSQWIPNTSGAAASYSVFTDDHGYERLTYYAAYTGLTGTYYRGKDAKADYGAFNLVMTVPQSATDLFAVNLSSSPYDAMWLGAYPAVPASGIACSYYMCSLSINRDAAFGAFCVYACSAPSYAYGINWGCRASPNFLEVEREARNGE